MFGNRYLERGKAVVAATACAWRCPCWDCRAARRRLLRLAAIGALLFLGTGGAAWELSRWALRASPQHAGALVERPGAGLAEDAPRAG